MPILNIQVVKPESQPAYPATRIQLLADELGEILKSGPANTWVRLEYLDSGQYAENCGKPDSEDWPVFVEIIKYSLPDEESLSTESKLVTKAVAETLDRPEFNVHVIYQPEGRGRVAFGGKLVPRD